MIRTLSSCTPGSTRRRVAAIASSIAVLLPASVLVSGIAAANPLLHRQGDGAGHHGHHGSPGTVVGGGSSGPELTTIFSGSTLGLTQPDDLAHFGDHLLVVFQNGLGPLGQAGPLGTYSTVVELSLRGAVQHTWNLTGHADGMAVDPGHDRAIVTVNEDGLSSLFTIDLGSGTAAQYHYSPSSLPHGGGTDAVSIVQGQILISASAPTLAAGPAVFVAQLDASTMTATLTGLFADNAGATIANTGSTQGQATTLALTDPDSNEVVPSASPRFGGDFVLDSQGDDEQIYVSNPGEPSQSLSVLSLSASVNDTAWATDSRGTLFISDKTNNLVDAFSGHFSPGTAYVAVTPCSDNLAPTICPAPPTWPVNYLGTLDLSTGAVTPVDLGGEFVQPQGLDFVPGASGRR